MARFGRRVKNELIANLFIEVQYGLFLYINKYTHVSDQKTSQKIAIFVFTHMFTRARRYFVF